VSSETTKRRIPVKRWIVLALILIGVYAAFLGPTFLRPVSPAVVLPGENTGLAIGGFQITNTLLATLIGDLALIVCALIAWSFSRSGKLVPEGFYGFFEFLIEFLWNAAEGAAGSKWARRIFPWTATIFLLVFSVNMTKLIPGFESIGRFEAAHGSAKGYAPVKLFSIGSMGVYTVDGTKPQPQEKHDEKKPEAKPAEVKPVEAGHAAEEKPHVCEKSCEVIPFLRGAPTDLNFTFALAAITVVLIQVFGLWALGAGYLTKFFNFRTMFTVPMFGVIDFAVGLLELVSEFAKILSFGFRLFGNIFAGALLISILGALTAVVVPSALYGLEVFVGVIQAYVFSMLALVFISQATVSHHGGEEHGEGHH